VSTGIYLPTFWSIVVLSRQQGPAFQETFANWGQPDITRYEGAFAKLRKATITSVMSVRPLAWNSLAPTPRIFLKFSI